ncbi:MAG: hypothetical protein WAU71_03285, partial [Pyrinomonadaceae bacterium]
MDPLNGYLKDLLSSSSDELRLEPDKNPYLVATDKTIDVANAPLKGTQISTLVFPLIPPSVKSELPHNSEIEFIHPHNLGNFNFHVQKSPSGFIVTIRPVLTDSGRSINVPKPLPDAPPAHTSEFSADYSAPIESFSEIVEECQPAEIEAVTAFEHVGYDLESS